MPVIVKFDNTTTCPQQAQIIQDASPNNDGVMTKVQAAKLASLTPGGGLPDQTGNAGKFLRTDGTSAAWEPLPGPLYSWGPFAQSNVSLGGGGNAEAPLAVRAGAAAQAAFYGVVPFDGFIIGATIVFQSMGTNNLATLPANLTLALLDGTGTDILSFDNPVFLAGIQSGSVDLDVRVGVAAGQALRTQWTDAGGGVPATMGFVIFWRMQTT